MSLLNISQQYYITNYLPVEQRRPERVVAVLLYRVEARLAHLQNEFWYVIAFAIDFDTAW